MAAKIDDAIEFIDEDEDQLDPSTVARFSDAVLYSMDWTIQTVINQLEQRNIDLTPPFQRRDAWSVVRKSQFIESVFLGLPIPQIVLAEKQDQRGSFIVLDGKQRLLSLLQFVGGALDSPNNAFALKGLDVRKDLAGKKYADLSSDPKQQADLLTFTNNTIRTVVIRNWPDWSFLHLVFLRLNTGSLKLSSQELRQALIPGDFSNFVDQAAGASKPLQKLLHIDEPDPRMRDVELLVRFLAFRNFLPSYSGRMKPFLDQACKSLNSHWPGKQKDVQNQAKEFDAGVAALIAIFGVDEVARKEGSRSFNRAIFDALLFYAADPNIRTAMLAKKAKVKDAMRATLANQKFVDAVESDTAGIPHTGDRLTLWGTALRDATKLKFEIPKANRSKIQFGGF